MDPAPFNEIAIGLLFWLVIPSFVTAYFIGKFLLKPLRGLGIGLAVLMWLWVYLKFGLR